MRIFELLNEVAVGSTWITSLTYNRPNKVLTLRTSRGSEYSIKGISRRMFDQWKSSPSKGTFFHDKIKDNYNVVKIK